MASEAVLAALHFFIRENGGCTQKNERTTAKLEAHIEHATLMYVRVCCEPFDAANDI